MNVEKIVLDNGLKVYLLCDKSKNVTLANLIVNFGGIDNKYELNGKVYKVKSGIAHFLEHLVLESNKYGDIMNIFSENGVRSNGLTSIERTEFYIDTVKDFYNNLKILLTGVHNPIFNDKIEDIRKPILEEKIKSLDNKYSNLYNASSSTYLNNNKFKSILGDIKDIKSINNNDLESVFKAFYRPSNEILVISGNFEKDTVLKTIEDSYKQLSFDNNNYKRVIHPYKDKVNKKEIILKDNTNIGRTVITYKINIQNIEPEEIIKLDTYIFSFLRMNFGITSKLNKYLIENKIVVGNIQFIPCLINGYYIIRIEANTDRKNDFVKNITEYINKKDFVFDEELFNLHKKGYIIDLITRQDNIYNLVEPFIHNLIFFNYEELDKVSDIESMTFKEFKDTINNLDYNNYSITELRKK